MDRNLKIALLTDGITPFVIGGMQKHSYYLSKLLPQQNIILTLVHCVPSNDNIPTSEEVLNELKIEKEFIKNIEVVGLKFPKQKSKLLGHYLRESYEYSEAIFDLIKSRLNEFDYIYAKGFTAWKLIEEKKKGLKCPPIGVKFHGLNMFQKAVNLTAKLQHLMFRPAVKFNMLNADYNFSYGGKISEITNEIGVEWDKILAFPTGIGEDWLYEDYQNKEVITFLFVGRYERLKGIEELNEAIESIEANYQFKFLFVGPIPDDKKINSFKVEYLGRIMDAEKLKKVYKNADIVVCPSYSEGMPNVIMEGMAQSLSTIATDVGAVNQMVNNKNGWLLHSSNPNEIKEALIAAILMSKDNLSLKKKDSYNIIVNNFLWGTIAQNISTRLNKIIK